MYPSRFALGRILVTAALALAVAVGLPSVARADDWGRDQGATQALASLDPAIRTAIAARHFEGTPPAATVVVPAGVDGFAWGAAALGVGVGVAAMCAVFACVTLVRHDGRLRNA
jgi:hypothetical protein